MADRILRWSVQITDRQIMMRGCNHEMEQKARGEELHPRDGCLACSISHGLRDSGMELAFFQAPDLAGRILTGTATTDAHRIFVSRLIAWAYGHPDPLLLVERRLADAASQRS